MQLNTTLIARPVAAEMVVPPFTAPAVNSEDASRWWASTHNDRYMFMSLQTLILGKAVSSKNHAPCYFS